MVRVKICGITRVEDARSALAAGAWALGFIFHHRSPRYIDPERAAQIVAALPEDVLSVGVFVDWSLEELNDVVRHVGLRAVQLHGSESPEYAAGVRAHEVWKAFRAGTGFGPEDVAPYTRVDRVLVDAYREDVPGGTGTTCDWDVARRVAEVRPVILAGGLNAANVGEALRRVKPEAVDVSSGVESRPGVKDRERLVAFFAEVGRHGR